MTKGFETEKRQKGLTENKPVDLRWNRDWKTYACGKETDIIHGKKMGRSDLKIKGHGKKTKARYISVHRPSPQSPNRSSERNVEAKREGRHKISKCSNKIGGIEGEMAHRHHYRSFP